MTKVFPILRRGAFLPPNQYVIARVVSLISFGWYAVDQSSFNSHTVHNGSRFSSRYECDSASFIRC